VKIRRLDVRGLEAPEPLERILSQLDSLHSGEQLDVVHWREPLLLYPILERRAWQYKTGYDKKSRTYLISIWKAEP
jgi:uncharacterized protein (DUF2249 family)